MRIGSLSLENPTVFAPLAGISNLPMRLLAKFAGCALVCSEMVSANGIKHSTAKTLRLLDSEPSEKPLSVQIFGSDAALMHDAAVFVGQRGADIIDINLGCSVRKVLKSGAGAALMRQPELAAAIFSAVRKSTVLPVTVKIRSGWDDSGDQAVQIARIAEDCGLDGIAVHPRSAPQGFRGRADWTVITRVKQAVNIPVIGNGDIVTAVDARAMMRQTGCDAVMIGRAAVANPLIFRQVRQILAGQPPEPIDLDERFDLMRRYIDASVSYLGATHACFVLRSRLGWLTRGMPGSSQFRAGICQIQEPRQAYDSLDAYYRHIANGLNNRMETA